MLPTKTYMLVIHYYVSNKSLQNLLVENKDQHVLSPRVSKGQEVSSHLELSHKVTNRDLQLSKTRLQ
jgi:hypothetical protein